MHDRYSPSAGNCNCYLITLQISYLNLSLSLSLSPTLQYFFVPLSIQLCVSRYAHDQTSAAARVCSVDVTPTCIKGLGGGREGGASRSIDTESIIDESTRWVVTRSMSARAFSILPARCAAVERRKRSARLRSADDFPLEPLPTPYMRTSFTGVGIRRLDGMN